MSPERQIALETSLPLPSPLLAALSIGPDVVRTMCQSVRKLPRPSRKAPTTDPPSQWPARIPRLGTLPTG